MDSHWRSTMMANAARDPLWRAKVASEVLRTPALRSVIEDKCATCHMPMARTESAANDEPVAIAGGLTSPEHRLHEAAMDGVSCTVCHQIEDRGLGTSETFSGSYPIDATTTRPDRLIYGLFEEPGQEKMRDGVGFTPVYGPQATSSGLCATCHTLFTPFTDEEGSVLGEFPEQMAYFEWLRSDYGPETSSSRSCQSCHMPEADGPVVISRLPKGLDPRSPFAQHFFVGGNVFMARLMSQNPDALGLTADSTHFEDTIARTLDQLQSRTAEIGIADVTSEDDVLAVQVRVENKTGHKFPTGFPSRRAWIHLTVEEEDGPVVFESGAPTPGGGIQGAAADLDPAGYDRHFDTISSPDEVQIYEAMMGDANGGVTYTLLRGSRYLKDNRLLPPGFEKAGASEDIAVRGRASEDPDFTGGGDGVTYAVRLPDPAAEVEISVQLLYQPVSYQFVQDLFLDQDPVIERFAEYWEAADKTPVVIAEVEREYP